MAYGLASQSTYKLKTTYNFNQKHKLEEPSEEEEDEEEVEEEEEDEEEEEEEQIALLDSDIDDSNYNESFEDGCEDEMYAGSMCRPFAIQEKLRHRIKDTLADDLVLIAGDEGTGKSKIMVCLRHRGVTCYSI